MTTTTARVLTALIASGALLAPATAHADLYWANFQTGTIGTANEDGTDADQNWITGATFPAGVAVDRRFVYWTNAGGNTIGRARLDGSNVNQSFISTGSAPYGVAVDGTHIYWANYDSDRIGRARLNGSGVNQSFVTGATDPNGVAADGTYVYWASYDTGAIGRVRRNGTGVNRSFITGASESVGVEVVGSRIYWTHRTGGGRIGRASYDGSGVDHAFVPLTVPRPYDVTSDGSQLFWGDFEGTTVTRANLDGTGVDSTFITGGNTTWGVAITPDPVGVSVGAKDRKRKFSVNVNPDLTEDQHWKFLVLKKRKNGGWKTLDTTFATEGDDQKRKINLRKGKYRARVLAAYGYGSKTSEAVTLKR